MGFFEGIQKKITKAMEVRKEIEAPLKDGVRDTFERHEKILNETLDRTGGKSKNVYIDPDNAELVIKHYVHGPTTIRDSNEFKGKNAESKIRTVEQQLKINFYLQKLLHILFPKNIPNRHLAVASPKLKLTIDERKRYSPVYRYYIPQTASDKEKNDYLDEPVRLLVEELARLDIGVDKADHNFGKDKNTGSTVYVDDLYMGEKSIELLKERIDSLEGDIAVRAKKLWERLRYWYDQHK